MVNLADLHGNHRFGLLNPATELDAVDAQGNVYQWTPNLNKPQEYLWELYSRHIDQVAKLAGNDPVDVIVSGDLTQGNKHRTEWVSVRIADEVVIGQYNLLPLVERLNVRKIRILEGTGAHNFGEGSSEILITRLLGSNQNLDVQFLYHGLFDVDGVMLDCAHHGPPPGSRYWLNGSVAGWYLRSLMMGEIAAGRKPPRVVSRAHYHTLVWQTVRLPVNGQLYESHIIVLPSYCWLSGHGRQATQSTPAQWLGMVVYEIADGALVNIHPLAECVDLRTKESL